MVKVTIILSACLAFLATSVIQQTNGASLLKDVELTKDKVEFVGGIVLYRISNGEIEYILLQKKSELDDWSNPKGNLEEGEDATLGAIRETFEETGLVYPTDFTIYSQEQVYFEYTTNDDEIKRVTLFPAKLKSNKPIEISDEHNAFVWVDYQNGVNMIKKQYKDAFKEARSIIEKLEGKNSH